MALVQRSFYHKDNFRQHMIAYIREHFSDLLGHHAKLLDQEDGLDRIADLINAGKIAPDL
ncbi:MAG: hypothetical protein R3C68_07055 [Myxococcota bacterium]